MLGINPATGQELWRIPSGENDTFDMRREAVLFVSGLLHAERCRRGTRKGRRCLGCFAQAILVIRWLRSGTRIRQLAAENDIKWSSPHRGATAGGVVLVDGGAKMRYEPLVAESGQCLCTSLVFDAKKTPGPGESTYSNVYKLPPEVGTVNVEIP